MSDQNKSDDGDWGLESLDEDDDIIELTDEVELPAKPAASGQFPLDDDVIDLEEEEPIHELPAQEAAETVAGFEDEVALPPEDNVHELMQAAMGDVEVEDLQAAEEDEPFVIDLGEDVALPSGEEVQELMAAEVEELDIEELQPIEETDEITLEPEEELPRLPEEEVLALTETETAQGRGTGIATGYEPADEPTGIGAGPDEDIIEISDFDQQYPDEEDTGGAGLPTPDAAGEEEYLDLLDIDEDDDGAELDDDIIQFDDGDTGEGTLELEDPVPGPPEMEFELESPAGPEDETAAGFQSTLADELPEEFGDAGGAPETEQEAELANVAPFFGASPGRGDDPGEPPGIPSEQDETGAVPQTQDASGDGAPSIPASVSSSQIEAAVAAVIERDYAGRIEGMVAAAIEKVVSAEIERIKARLFSDEDD